MNRKQRRGEKSQTGARQGMPDPRRLFGEAARCHQAGRLAEADRICRHILTLAPRHAESHHLLGVIALEAGHPGPALAMIGEAIRISPERGLYHANLGLALRRLGRLDEAIACFRQAIERQPDDADSHYALGAALHDLGRLAEATAAYREALRLRPNFPEAHNNLGNAWCALGRLDQAVASYRAAIELRPNHHGALFNLGLALRDLGRVAEAVCAIRQALVVRPDAVNVHIALGRILLNQGEDGEARACFQRAGALRPDHPAAAILDALACPVIPAAGEIPAIRARIAAAIAAIPPGRPPFADPMEVGLCNFYPSYHGEDDRALQGEIAAMYRRVFPAIDQDLVGGRRPVGGRIRIGFVSAFLKAHTIGKLNSGLIRRLDPARFETIVLRTQPAADPLAQEIDAAAARAILLPPSLEAARRTIAELNLDVLYYTDIGMDPFTYYLAFSRLAPVQTVTWGHPVTTGLATIDYFLSSELLEPPDGERLYAETLVRLPSLNTYYCRPQPPARRKSRAEFGVDPHARLYVCPQTPFKFHPDFDAILAGILDRDRRAHLVFITGTPHWETLLRRRWNTTLPDHADRVTFLPNIPQDEFFSLLMEADAVLDTPHFSGGNSSIEAFAMAVPIVAVPGRQLRGRITAACYRAMGMMDLVADNADHAVELAVRLANDADFHRLMADRIGAASHILFENPAVIAETEAFLTRAVAAAGETA